MSEKESVRAAIHILTEQLTQLTFDAGLYDPHTLLPSLEGFFTRFEAILETINSLTHSTFPDSVKKTMLQAQLSGITAHWAWVAEVDHVRRLSYGQLKDALRNELSQQSGS